MQAYDQPGVPPEQAIPLDRFSGTDFIPRAGYAGPGQGVGNRVVPATFYGPGDGWEDRAQAWKRADAWMDFVGQKLSGAITFLYLPDEPGEAAVPGHRRVRPPAEGQPRPGRQAAPAGDPRPAPGPGRRRGHLVLDRRRCSIRRWPRASGPPAASTGSTTAAARTDRRWCIDAPISDARVIGWMAFKADVPVYFYWHAVHWQHNRQKQVGPRQQNVWADPVTFDRRRADGRGEFANGDGVLLFPGTDRLHPAEDRGIAGPIGTVQLANLRRGLQDHLYLTLARQRGHQALVNEVVQAIVPRVFNQAGREVSFPQSSAPFEQARRRLARALSAR